MDPALWELLKQGEGNDEIAAILRLRPGENLPPEVRRVTQFGEIATVRMRRSTIQEVRADESVASLKAPRLLGPDVDIPVDPEWDIETALDTDRRRPASLEYTGKNVVVGVLDWGIDFAHPDFRHPDGSTRLLALWDQRGPGADNYYGYGRIHTAEAINAALATSTPYTALGYHPGDTDPTGVGSHGTHVASIAAGSSNGVAPDADLVFVHLSTSGTGGLANLGDSVTILEAIDFVLKTAGKRPTVINMSVGRHAGPHDGRTLVEQGLDAIVGEAPGRAICQSTGNYYNQFTHASGQLKPGETHTLNFYVDAADVTPNEIEVWYPAEDIFSVKLCSPDSTINHVVPHGESLSFQANGRETVHIYHRAHDPNNHDHHVNIFLYPGCPSGEWQLSLMGQDIVDGRYHSWIERDAACRGCQSRFRAEASNPEYTTGTICNGYRTIAVGAYNPHHPEKIMAEFSSRGPTRDGRMKPNLIAPGVAITGARSASGESAAGENQFVRKSGTSMAAPHVTGTIALMFEAASDPLPVGETRRLLLQNADPIQNADLYRTGNGYLNIERAVRAAAHVESRESSEEMDMSEYITEDDLEDRLEVFASLAEDEPESFNLGNIFFDGRRHPVSAESTTPEYTSTTLDDALQFALTQTRTNTLILGDMFGGREFQVLRWSSPAPTLPVIEFDRSPDQSPVVALLIFNGRDVYMRDGTGARWSKLNRPREFYALAETDRNAQRRKWIRRINDVRTQINIPGVTVDTAWLNQLSMPALRLLLARFSTAIFRVQNVDQPDRRFRGGLVNGLTLPVLNFPMSEPDCYLPVIAGREGVLESINTYDEGAGVSLGPIQFNVIRTLLFQFLWNVHEEDPELLSRTFPEWTMRTEGGTINLIIRAGQPDEIILRGREADRNRNVGYFQSGVPGQTGFEQINAAFRRDMAARFRTLVAWPHVQEKVITTSVTYLNPGLTMIHEAANRIPALDPANPDRETFILKALLLSAYVRYSACLQPFLIALRAWTTPAEKLRNWRNALNSAQAWGGCTQSRRQRLIERLTAQETEAEQVFEMITRLIQQNAAYAPFVRAGQQIIEPIARVVRAFTDTIPETVVEEDTEPACAEFPHLEESNIPGISESILTEQPAISADKFFESILTTLAGNMSESMPLAAVYDNVVRGGTPYPHLDIVALPGSFLSEPLQPGDILLRRGDGPYTHAAVLGNAELLNLDELVTEGFASEGKRPGFYTQVIEGGVYPHQSADKFYRRILDSEGCLPADTLILRLHNHHEGITESDAEVPDSSLASQFVEAHPSRWCRPGQTTGPNVSPTCSPMAAPRTINCVVIHSLAVPSTSRRTGVQSVVLAWQREGRQASAHYLIDRDGSITQMVRESDVAFHTSRSYNRRSIGIEHADVCNDPAPYTEQLYESSAALVRDLAARHGFTPLVYPLDESDINRATIFGHVDIGAHGDPGPYWDWEYYSLLLRWNGTTQASKPIRITQTVQGTPPVGWSVNHRNTRPNSHCARATDPYGAIYWTAPATATTGVVYRIQVNTPGLYKVSLWWPRVPGATRAALVTIQMQNTPTQTMTVDQSRNHGRWNDAGIPIRVNRVPDVVTVQIGPDGSTTQGKIIADAVRLLKTG